MVLGPGRLSVGDVAEVGLECRKIGRHGKATDWERMDGQYPHRLPPFRCSSFRDLMCWKFVLGEEAVVVEEGMELVREVVIALFTSVLFGIQ